MKSILFVMVLFLLCCGAATAGAAEMSVAGEKNNVDHDASLIIGSSLPDLAVLTFEPPSGAVNRTFTISNAVRNQGAATAGPFTVWFALSSDTTFTLEDTLIGTREIRSSLGVGASSATQDTTVTIPDSVPGGSYYVGMFVDTTNAVAESDETNNFDYDPDRISILAAQPPDIGFWIFFTDPGWDARVFDVDAEVRNYGTGPTGPFTVGFYLSNDTTFTTADILIGEEQVADLAADATAYVGQFVTVPASVPAGSYYLGMIMDTRNTVTESNEANNVVYDQTMISIAAVTAPDIAEWTFAPPSGSQPRTFTIYSADKNIGTAPTGPFTVGFYLSNDLTFTTSDVLIGTRQYAGLAAGAAGLNEETTVTIPQSVPAGSYYLGKIMDPTNAVAESNENNNVFFDLDPISITAAPAPDIGGQTFMAAYGVVVTRTATFRNDVRNYGTASTGPFTVGFYLSGDTTITTADTLLGTEQFADLGAGVTAPIKYSTFDIPDSVPVGSYYLGMIMDIPNAVAESNETNNTMLDPDLISITDLPDIAHRTFAPPSGAVARTFTISNAVENFGRTSTGPFTVGFYLSSDTTIATSDVLIGTRQYTDLGAGAAAPDENTAMTIPDSVPPGSYYVGEIMDMTNAVAEAVETNNIIYAVSPISITAVPAPGVVTVPGGAGTPTDINVDGKYEDVNGNGRKDFADVVLYFNQMTWIGANEPAGCFDFNGNTRVDFADVVWLFNHL